MLHRALQELKQTEEFALVIQESSAGHELLFRGSVKDELVLKGILPEHDLEVYYAGKSVYARKAGVKKWEEARELNSLSGFLFSPVRLLHLLSPYFDQARAGQEIRLESLPCLTVYLDFTGDLDLIKTLFPQIDTDVFEAVTLGAAFNKANLSISQLRVLVEFKENDLLERAYYINPNHMMPYSSSF